MVMYDSDYDTQLSDNEHRYWLFEYAMRNNSQEALEKWIDLEEEHERDNTKRI